MKPFSSFFKRSPNESSADELGGALREAEAQRQMLREREQALAVDRQRALLTGSDDELDAIEEELVKVQRAAERHDLRIPELRRLHADRQAAEQRAADERAFNEALRERMTLCERFDTALSGIGQILREMEATAGTLRGLDGYHGAHRRFQGPMSEMRLDRQALISALLLHAPDLARGLNVHDQGVQRRESYRAYEGALWAGLRNGPAPQPAVAQFTPPSEEALDAREASRALGVRYK